MLVCLLCVGCASVPRPDPVGQVAALRHQDPGAAKVAEGLASSDGRVQYFAFQAAPRVVTDPDVREQLLRLAASPHPYLAVPALETLSEPDRFSLDDGVAAAFFQALSHSDPAVVATALDRMGTAPESFSARPGFYEKVLSLAQSAPPLVSGRALELSRRMAPPAGKAALAGMLRRKLRDPNPYVRSKAAEALGEMGDKTAIPALLGMLSDHSNSEARVSYVDLLGETVSLEDQGSTWGRVDDAALYALHMLDEFEYGQVDPDHLDRDLAREARRARDAYRAR